MTRDIFYLGMANPMNLATDPIKPQGGWELIELGEYKEGITIAVDIKPGSCPNPISLKNQGVIPFAIMGTVEFDVAQIDPESIRITRDGVNKEVAPLRWSYDDVATPFAGELCDCHTLKGDGFIDLALKVDAQEVIQTLKIAEVVGETIPLTVTGKLYDEFGGIPIRGEDCVRVSKK
jgi:hypothetical protein